MQVKEQCKGRPLLGATWLGCIGRTVEGEGALEPKRASLKVASLSTLEAKTPLWPASPFRSKGAMCSSLLAAASPANKCVCSH